ncbi:hypothetical protein [Micromonospora siamensis]|uniref:Uncharacterized protein n=1 Tax=Micromonospora siamensis TaxID=299152 RepID=A0A1C5IQZ0_9ACTN|nr:hypothetical protein [Micromonospora siamensis]SCG60732.1 hypothetical protein GA0074704_3715 [Micromonospora siamensis]
MTSLLPGNALAGVRVGLSASDSPDLARLGLLPNHFRLALAEIARTVLVGGGTLAYGGHLRPDGHTAFLLREVQRYGPLDSPPLLLALAWQNHRQVPLPELRRLRDEAGLYAGTVFLDPAGGEVDPARERGDEPAPVAEADRAPALTAMRSYLAERVDGRVVIGGRRSGFGGRMPGLIEEVLLALDHGTPLYLAGGFGGTTWDILRVLGLGDPDWLPPDEGAEPPDPRYRDAIAQLAARAGDVPDNGLTTQENRRLAETHRPSEIAGLVGLGLGRLHSATG